MAEPIAVDEVIAEAKRRVRLHAHELGVLERLKRGSAGLDPSQQLREVDAVLLEMVHDRYQPRPELGYRYVLGREDE